LIQPGDQISVSVLGQEELAVEVVVPRQGGVKLPRVGLLRVAGTSPATLSSGIAEALRERNVLLDPDVTVFITRYATKRIYLYGALERSSMIEVPRHQVLTLSQAIAMTGGFTRQANAKQVQVVRRLPGQAPQFLTVDTTQLADPSSVDHDVALVDGDVVVVGQEERFYLMGQVRKPGAYTVDNASERTLIKLLGMAGGFTQGARSTEVLVMLKQPDGGYENLRVNARDMLEGMKIENDFPVTPGSIIYVPLSFW
jgi:polysaccharide export outer membrane protein